MRIRSGTRRLSIAVVALGLLALSACGGDDGDASGNTSPSRVDLIAGLNVPDDLNIALLAFMPKSAKVVEGAEVTWTIAGPEPHTVTFVGAGQPTPSPDSPEAVQPIGSPGPYDGTTTVSSGLQPTAPEAFRFTLTFPKAGTYDYVCAVHPTMRGTIEVVTGEAESQQQINERARSERDAYVEEGRAAKAALTETPAGTEQNPDGTTTHIILMGTTTEHTDILAFQPVTAAIEAGDKIVFLNDSGAPHTATFAGQQSLPTNPESPEAMAAAPGPSPQTLNATDFFNTGWLPPNAPPGAGPPAAARSYTYTVPAAGTYAYVCLLHVPSKMAGSIVAT